MKNIFFCKAKVRILQVEKNLWKFLLLNRNKIANEIWSKAHIKNLKCHTEIVWLNNFLIISLAKIQPSDHKKITLICMSDLWRQGLSTSVQSKCFCHDWGTRNFSDPQREEKEEILSMENLRFFCKSPWMSWIVWQKLAYLTRYCGKP